MTGNNTLILNTATMIEAVQLWLDSRMQAPVPTVTAVEPDKANYDGTGIEMSELEKLRPEVREAVKNFDDLLGGFGDVREFRWQTIRAELLRLADECAMIPRAQLLANFVAANERAEKAEADLATAQNTINAQQGTMGALKRKLALSEGELAALKAKIEAAPLTTFRRAMLGTPHAWVEEKFACPEWIGKRVRLLVED